MANLWKCEGCDQLANPDRLIRIFTVSIKKLSRDTNKKWDQPYSLIRVFAVCLCHFVSFALILSFNRPLSES